MDTIWVENVAVNNLKNISVRIPLGQIVAVVGPSGSGKSSLAYDVIYREGLRQRGREIRGQQGYMTSQERTYRISKLPLVRGLSQRVEPERKVTSVAAYSGILPELQANILKTCEITCPTCGRMLPVMSESLCSICKSHCSGDIWVTISCQACGGRGHIRRVHLERMIRNRERGVTKGAVMPLVKLASGLDLRLYRHLCSEFDPSLDPSTPYKDLPHRFREVLLFGGTGELAWWEGIVSGLEKAFQELEVPKGRVRRKHDVQELIYYFPFQRCENCGGSGLGPVADSFSYKGTPIRDILISSFDDVNKDFPELFFTTRSPMKSLFAPVDGLGLGYLSMAQPVFSLSLGEINRLRMIKLANELPVGGLLIADEPCAGFHPTERVAIADFLRDIVDSDRSVIVVEHAREVISKADYVIEFGPGGGANGGEIIFEGTIKTFREVDTTTSSLVFQPSPGVPSPLRVQSRESLVSIKSINETVFSDFDFTFPLNRFICVTGLSGVGKSSLLSVIFRALDKSSQAWMGLRGIGEVKDKRKIRRPYFVDQSPIGNNPRSTPATYLGIWDQIRKVFSETREAKHLGFGVSHFSFNTSDGWCRHCQGLGHVLVTADEESVWNYCPICNGSRYNQEVLKVRYAGISIADALRLTVDQAVSIFSDSSLVTRRLSFLKQVNLGYLTLGQPSVSLSGGESQRIRLARVLSKRLGDRCVYILDTPSRGLHLQDLPVLADVFRSIVAKNNTVIITDNHWELIREADLMVKLECETDGRSKIAYFGPPDF